MSTQTDGCFSRKSSGSSVYGIRWNHISFMADPPIAGGPARGGRLLPESLACYGFRVEGPHKAGPLTRSRGRPAMQPRSASRIASASRFSSRVAANAEDSIPQVRSVSPPASAAQGSVKGLPREYSPTPRNRGSTYPAGTLKFLKLQTGKVETSKTAGPGQHKAHRTTGTAPRRASPVPAEGICSAPAKNGNSASPAPAGAGTPVKKFTASAGRAGRRLSSAALNRASRSASRPRTAGRRAADSRPRRAATSDSSRSAGATPKQRNRTGYRIRRRTCVAFEQPGDAAVQPVDRRRRRRSPLPPAPRRRVEGEADAVRPAHSPSMVSMLGTSRLKTGPL